MFRFRAAALAAALLVPVAAGAQDAAQVLTLDDAVRIALENQPSLRRARADTDAAEAGVAAARAPLLPQVSAQTGYQFQQRPTAVDATPFVRAGRHNFSVGGTVDQLVTDFGKSTNRLRASAALEDAQRESQRDVETSVVANVRNAFFTARARKSLVGVATRILENQQRHFEQVDAFVELGARSPYDLAQARTNVGSARSQLAAAEGNYRVARARLVQAMGLSQSAEFDVADQSLPPIAGEGGSADELLPDALAARPDVKALEQRIQAQEYTLRSNRAGYLPSIGLNAGVSEIGPGFNDLSTSWVAGATLTWPIFQGGATRAAVSQADAALAGLVADKDSLTQQVRYELEESLAGIDSSLAARASAEETVESAREQVRLAEGRYETGVGSLLELSDAELALQQAESALVQAEYDLSSARALLLERLGQR
ncbi:TolC family protein [Vulgatibacter incomptus]|uniref:RND efflux system, outer membrane lipoprotein CmeC n=1 Tax=Vulgatibacter incomptus TaxID=1391653 RepID=A0A0K1PBJ0_9BACT|nr:TolC family protein [Vulgatibacter incomptus]AKU90862.1 RND efflux system, outer membrane lipoprotein CmeC [Vulgatibacter incomptus]